MEEGKLKVEVIKPDSTLGTIFERYIVDKHVTVVVGAENRSIIFGESRERRAIRFR